MTRTGWPSGLLQDDCKKLSRWFASRLGAQYLLRLHMDDETTHWRQKSPVEKAHRLALEAISELAKMDPDPDSLGGRLLVGLADAVEGYEKVAFPLDC